MNLYFKAIMLGIKNVYIILENLSDNLQFDLIRDELEYHLLSIIHLTGDIYARLVSKKVLDKLDEKDKDFFLAFIYLNNQVKHDATLDMIYYDVSGNILPLKLPFRFGKPGALWRYFEDHSKNTKAKREYYDKYLVDKDVYSTIKQLEKTLVSYGDLINREV